MPPSEAPESTPNAPLWHLGPEDVAPAPAPTAAQAGAALRRRQLLRGGFWAGMAVLTAGGLAAAADLLNPHAAPIATNHIRVAGRLVPRPGGPPYYDRDNRFFLINLRPGEGLPDAVRGQAELFPLGAPSHFGGLLALSAHCPFQGCTVTWRPDFEFIGVTGWLRCPCCGSIFTKAGLHVFGPAPRALDTLQIVSVSDSGVVVNLAELHRGDPSDAQRTVAAGPFKK